MTTRPFVIGVDLDGVVADYVDGLRQYVAEVKSIDPSSIPDPIDYAFWHDPLWPIADHAEFHQLHGDAVGGGLFSRLNVIEDARNALWELSDMGVYIRIVTHRLQTKGQYGWIQQQTSMWLDKNDIPMRGIAYERWKTDVAADIYIDDSPGNVEELRAAGSNVIVFNTAYNREIEGLRAYNWIEAKQIIEERFHDRGF